VSDRLPFQLIADMAAQHVLVFSAEIEAFRRRVTARMMRGVFRADSVSGARLPHAGIHRILICRSVHTLGDSLTLTPLLTELADVYPGAEVDIVCGCPVADALFEAFPDVRAVHRMPQHIPGHLLATARTLHAMRRKHYDLAVDPDPQSQSGRLPGESTRLWCRGNPARIRKVDAGRSLCMSGCRSDDLFAILDVCRGNAVLTAIPRAAALRCPRARSHGRWRR
jgi:hypothetical protein